MHEKIQRCIPTRRLPNKPPLRINGPLLTTCNSSISNDNVDMAKKVFFLASNRALTIVLKMLLEWDKEKDIKEEQTGNLMLVFRTSVFCYLFLEFIIRIKFYISFQKRISYIIHWNRVDRWKGMLLCTKLFWITVSFDFICSKSIFQLLQYIYV